VDTISIERTIRPESRFIRWRPCRGHRVPGAGIAGRLDAAHPPKEETPVNFEFSDEQKAFADEVEKFLDDNDTLDVMDVTRENMAQIVDTPARRAFMRKMGERGWLGMTWPKEYGGQEGEGIYEYLLNESLARRGAPQIGKGVGIIGKTLIRHGSEKLKQEFLPKILRNEVEFAIGYSEPNAGSDAAAMQLKATRDGDGWRLNGQKIWTTSAHFAEWYWVGARTDPDAVKHHGISLFLIPMDHPGLTIQEIWTIGDERTNSVYFDNVYVSNDYVVGELNKGFQYISEALDLERFTMFTYSPILQRLELLCDHVKNEKRDGELLRKDPVIRQQIAHLVTEGEVARVLGLRFVAKSMKGGAPPTCEASTYKLYATELSRRLADASMDIVGPGAQLRVHTEEAPMKGRAESTYRYTVIDTIGGGASEIQKNIIARRKLGLPKNF
jgi:alkylation response protein AidB-like acyl-CoA dehydrogenase